MVTLRSAKRLHKCRAVTNAAVAQRGAAGVSAGLRLTSSFIYSRGGLLQRWAKTTRIERRSANCRTMSQFLDTTIKSNPFYFMYGAKGEKS